MAWTGANINGGDGGVGGRGPRVDGIISEEVGEGWMGGRHVDVDDATDVIFGL